MFRNELFGRVSDQLESGYYEKEFHLCSQAAQGISRDILHMKRNIGG